MLIIFRTDITTCDTVDRVKLCSCSDVKLNYLLHLYGHLPTCFLVLETTDPVATEQSANMAI